MEDLDQIQKGTKGGLSSHDTMGLLAAKVTAPAWLLPPVGTAPIGARRFGTNPGAFNGGASVCGGGAIVAFKFGAINDPRAYQTSATLLRDPNP
jgi:hypothetical protein